MQHFITTLLLIACLQFQVKGQNPLSQSTQVEVGVGYIQPQFRKGAELLRSKELRSKGLSYYQDANGNRKAVGSYASPNGFNLSIAYYKPIKRVKGLMLGSIVRNAQTGSNPSDGGYEEAYFFNFITAAVAAKYYPFQEKNLFVKADFGMAAVLTKNRFINSANEQNFFHQFGIGSATGLEVGYAISPWANKEKVIEFKLGGQLANTRVEVNGIGDDNWQFSAFYLGGSFIF